jgi:hypothetical protein
VLSALGHVLLATGAQSWAILILVVVARCNTSPPGCKDLVYGKVHDGLLKLAVRSRKSVEEVFEYQTIQEIQKALLADLDNEQKADTSDKVDESSKRTKGEDFCRLVKGVPVYAGSKVIADTASPSEAPATHTLNSRFSPAPPIHRTGPLTGTPLPIASHLSGGTAVSECLALRNNNNGTFV